MQSISRPKFKHNNNLTGSNWMDFCMLKLWKDKKPLRVENASTLYREIIGVLSQFHCYDSKLVIFSKSPVTFLSLTALSIVTWICLILLMGHLCNLRKATKLVHNVSCQTQCLLNTMWTFSTEWITKYRRTAL